MKFWELATSVTVKKRAAVVFLTLTGKAREAILEMDVAELDAEDGMSKLYAKLDELFKEDKGQATLNAYEKFEKFKRPAETSIGDYRVEFDRLVQQLKYYDIDLPEPVLAYRALKSANLSEENERLVRATVPDITLKHMMKQLQKVVGMDSQKTEDSGNPVKVKVEPNVNLNSVPCGEELGGAPTEDVFYGQYGRGNFSRGGRRPRYSNSNRRGYGGMRNNRGTRKANPTGPDGRTSTCRICGSFMHWVRDCPHKEGTEKTSLYEAEEVSEAHIVLVNTIEQKNSLLGQTIGSAILDSGCSRTVCGSEWYECFRDTLSEKQKNKLVPRQSDSLFRFGNGAELHSQFKVNIPCKLAGKQVEILTDVIDSPIPLLLSKRSMKKADCLLNFADDTVNMFGRAIKLHCTSSGHYFVKLTGLGDECQANEILFVKGLSVKSDTDKKKAAVKLHKQFSHPSCEKLLRLVKQAGVKDKQFLKMIEETPLDCEVCVRFKKSKPRPVVGMPLASAFNELLAMDIKEIRGTKVLHMVDHATRYSAATVLKTKEAKEIVTVVMRSWVAYFGAPKSFLTDNGREFDNVEFREMAQNINSVVRTTAAFSPWSNGLNERHNALLGDMVVKTMEDAQCGLEMAVPWAVAAKNALTNVHGFSSNQLVFGYNPNTPSLLTNAPPALECSSSSETVAKNLNAMHAARTAFMKSECSEKLQRALRHQIRVRGSDKFENGDMVYFKRPNSDRWMGPGSVIGQENKQVLVKHGGTYVRVHPCSLQRYETQGVDILGKDMKSKVVDTGAKTPAPSESHESPVCDLGGEEYQEVQVEHQEDGQQHELEYEMEESGSSHNTATTNSHGQADKTPSAGVARRQIDKKWNLPLPGAEVCCRMIGDGEEKDWKNVKVISRGGKATGANKFVMNVSIDGGHPTWVDFKKSVAEWKHKDQVDEEDAESEDSFESVDEVYAVQELSGYDWIAAKERELSSWKDNYVFTEVKDYGQDRIQCRWICTTKDSPEGKIAKARLVAKGFQDVDADSTRSDSPTCAKDSIRMVLMLIAANDWDLNSMDIKTAFLQGKEFDRDVFLVPPPEAKVHEGLLWKLNKCVYGLTDASRVWYLSVREELIKLGMRPSVHDEAIFTYKVNCKLQGLVSTHVDDFCWAGSKQFEDEVIAAVKRSFKVKSEDKYSFKYLGLQLSQENDKIRIKQDKYVQNMQLINVPKKSSPTCLMSEVEMRQCRSALGKLNWLATQTRPDLSFQVSELSSALRTKQVNVMYDINKAIRKAKKEPSQVVIPRMPELSKCRLMTYSDASFANVEGVKSQGGYITYVTNNEHSFPLSWQSQKIKRVVKSTQAAETLALVDAAEASLYYQSFIRELAGSEETNKFPVHCKTDNASLHASVHSNTQILDKRLRIETAMLRQMLARKELASISWVATKSQFADALTKAGTPSSKILQ